MFDPSIQKTMLDIFLTAGVLGGNLFVALCLACAVQWIRGRRRRQMQPAWKVR